MASRVHANVNVERHFSLLFHSFAVLAGAQSLDICFNSFSLAKAQLPHWS